MAGNLDLLDDFFRQYGDYFSWTRPAGGSICFPRAHAFDDTYAFCEKLVAETGIMLLPSRMFNYGDRHVRIGFGRDDFEEVLVRFSAYLDSI